MMQNVVLVYKNFNIYCSQYNKQSELKSFAINQN